MSEHHYIDVKNLVKIFRTGNITVNAVDHVSFYVDKGEFIGIMGASGSGKTTVLNILSTIDAMSDGQVFYDGIDISSLNEAELSDFRRENLGFVFQDYNLLDTLSIEENIMLPMALNGEKKDEMESRIKNISETLHIGDILRKFPYEISGGQKQR
ncbi:MAG: ATP-binding cassette domain-containing protein, partial [Lachnospiraceae bacterium]|nr:ATP-binding cassette domain-containing protein [Lachnospiraceae bacterium]